MNAVASRSTWSRAALHPSCPLEEPKTMELGHLKLQLAGQSALPAYHVLSSPFVFMLVQVMCEDSPRDFGAGALS